MVVVVEKGKLANNSFRIHDSDSFLGTPSEVLL